MAVEPIVVDNDPRPGRLIASDDVVVAIDVPDKATSSGWGDMSWASERRNL